MSDKILAWHFTGDTLRDGRPLPKIGEPLRHDGPVTICNSGLHASREPWDALQYAPGSWLHRVECSEIVTEQDDKLVCRCRTVLQVRDATDMLRRFAKDQALSVAHLWEIPKAVRDYLEGDDETNREGASAAALAAWEAARAAAREAAGVVVWSTAGDAAWDAARESAWAAARAAASAAAWEAARAAAWAAARAAASVAASVAAWEAARAAASAAARDDFNRRVELLFGAAPAIAM